MKDSTLVFEGWQKQAEGIWLELVGLGNVEVFAGCPLHGLEEGYVYRVTGTMRFADLNAEQWVNLIDALERKRYVVRRKAGLLPEPRRQRQ
jgi:hypothetical protein